MGGRKHRQNHGETKNANGKRLANTPKIGDTDKKKTTPPVASSSSTVAINGATNPAIPSQDVQGDLNGPRPI